MNFPLELSEDQRALRAMIREFAEAEIAPRAGEWDRRRARVENRRGAGDPIQRVEPASRTDANKGAFLVDHVEKQNPGCVGNALNRLKSAPGASVGAQIFDYLLTEGRLADTYPEFIKSVLLAALPDAGRYSSDNIVITMEYENGSVGTITYVASGDKALG